MFPLMADTRTNVTRVSFLHIRTGNKACIFCGRGIRAHTGVMAGTTALFAGEPGRPAVFFSTVSTQRRTGMVRVVGPRTSGTRHAAPACRCLDRVGVFDIIPIAQELVKSLPAQLTLSFTRKVKGNVCGHESH